MRGLRKFITWERQGIMSMWPRSILWFVRLSSCSNKSPAKSPGWNGNTTLHRESRHLIWSSVSAVSCNLSKSWFPHMWKEEFKIPALSTSRGLWENLKKVNKNFFVNYKTTATPACLIIIPLIIVVRWGVGLLIWQGVSSIDQIYLHCWSQSPNSNHPLKVNYYCVSFSYQKDICGRQWEHRVITNLF